MLGKTTLHTHNITFFISSIMIFHRALIFLYTSQVQNPHNIKYSGTIQGLKYIWKTEGFRGLFKGNGTNCARIVPNSAVKFFSYEQASKYVAFKFHFLYITFIACQMLITATLYIF